MSLKYHLRLLIFTVAATAVITGFGFSQTTQKRDAGIEALQREIDAKGYHWTAKRTWVTDLPDDEFQTMLGLRVPEDVQRRAGAPGRETSSLRRATPSP